MSTDVALVVSLVLSALLVANRGARGPQPMPRVARRAAALAGVAWILAALEFLVVALAVAFVNTAVSYNPDYVPPRVPRPVFLVAWIAAPVTLVLGLLLFVPTRRVLVWSTLWAALVVEAAAIMAVVLPRELVGAPEAFAAYVTVPVVAGLLSLLAWRQLAEGRRPPSPTV